MSDDKKRFGARVQTDTLEALDREADSRGLNRSETIEAVVDEWQEAGGATRSYQEYWADIFSALATISAVLLLALAVSTGLFAALKRPSLVATGFTLGVWTGSFGFVAAVAVGYITRDVTRAARTPFEVKRARSHNRSAPGAD